tara:strand:- start:652 stop:1071 length:420 start_codon:yes stop_codon:yes gene_type:complete
MSIILGIDYGEKRTGIAVTDSLKTIASSFQTIETKLLIDFLRKFIEQNNVDSIVIGLPRQKDYSFSNIENEIQIFISKLKKILPKLKIFRHDERYTSKMAKKIISEVVSKKSLRRKKELVDSVSATIILQSYLEKNNKL